MRLVALEATLPRVPGDHLPSSLQWHRLKPAWLRKQTPITEKDHLYSFNSFIFIQSDDLNQVINPLMLSLLSVKVMISDSGSPEHTRADIVGCRKPKFDPCSDGLPIRWKSFRICWFPLVFPGFLPLEVAHLQAWPQLLHQDG